MWCSSLESYCSSRVESGETMDKGAGRAQRKFVLSCKNVKIISTDMKVLKYKITTGKSMQNFHS